MDTLIFIIFLIIMFWPIKTHKALASKYLIVSMYLVYDAYRFSGGDLITMYMVTYIIFTLYTLRVLNRLATPKVTT